MRVIHGVYVANNKVSVTVDFVKNTFKVSLLVPLAVWCVALPRFSLLPRHSAYKS